MAYKEPRVIVKVPTCAGCGKEIKEQVKKTGWCVGCWPWEVK